MAAVFGFAFFVSFIRADAPEIAGVVGMDITLSG